MFEVLGDRIKKRRLSLGMSQSDLSKGICTQSQISRIEKDNLIPMSNLLYEIAKRLDTSMDYLYGNFSHGNLFFEQKKIYDDLLYKRDYKNIENMLNMGLIDTNSVEGKIYVFFLKGILCFQKEKYDKALFFFESGEKLSTKHPEMLLLIYNAKSILLMSLEKYNEALDIIYYALEIIKTKNIKEEITIKIYHSLVIILINKKSYLEALEYSLEAINVSISLKSNILLADLFYDKALLLYKLENHNLDEINNLLISSKTIAKIENKYTLIKKIDLLSKKLENKDST